MPEPSQPAHRDQSAPEAPHELVLFGHDLHKFYRTGNRVVRALDGVSVAVGRGEFLCVMGPSGSGKTTLLSVLAGLERPSSGTVLLEGINLTTASTSELAMLRRHKTGFVFQQYHLLKHLTALENVILPIEFKSMKAAKREQRAVELLTLVGLRDRARHFPGQLSGGEQQRVAIARALANAPAIVFADEPTGNLDQDSAEIVVELMADLNRNNRQTFLVVSHDPVFLHVAGRVLRMKYGRLVLEDQ